MLLDDHGAALRDRVAQVAVARMAVHAPARLIARRAVAARTLCPGSVASSGEPCMHDSGSRLRDRLREVLETCACGGDLRRCDVLEGLGE